MCLANIPPVCGSGVFDNIDKATCSLNVPEEALSAYLTADGWKDFVNIQGIPTVIGQVETDATPLAKTYFDLTGKPLSQQQRGINLVRCADGTTRKVIIR